jgi:hypothetical protein
MTSSSSSPLLSITPLVRHVLKEHARTRRAGLPELLDPFCLVPADDSLTAQAIAVSLRPQTDAQLLPLWSHFRAKQREPFYGSQLQTALQRLHERGTGPQAFDLWYSAVQMLEREIGLLWAYVVCLPTLPAPTPAQAPWKAGQLRYIVCTLFEHNGGPIFVGYDKAKAPVFAFVCLTSATMFRDAADMSDSRPYLCFGRGEDDLLKRAQRAKNETWRPASGGEGAVIRILTAGWLEPGALDLATATTRRWLPPESGVVRSEQDSADDVESLSE